VKKTNLLTNFKTQIILKKIMRARFFSGYRRGVNFQTRFELPDLELVYGGDD